MTILSLGVKVQQKEHKLKVNNSDKDSVKKSPSKVIITRGMKSVARTLFLNQQERRLALANNVQDVIEKVFTTSISSKTDFVDRLSHTFILPGENLIKQTILKGSFARYSEKKSMFVDSLKNQMHTSEKIVLENSSEKADVRFIPELLTASRYAETSDKIRSVQLNSEQTNKTTIESRIHTGNARADLNITYEINDHLINVMRDIKSGNNMNNIARGILGEIPYKENGKLYEVINQPLSLKIINGDRIVLLTERYQHDNKVWVFVETMQRLEPLLDESEILYNNAIQQELYNIMALDKTINFSYYYGVIVKEGLTNPEFFKRLNPYINNDIFNSKKHFNLFMSKAIIIYHNTVAPILDNVQNTKGTLWEATFLDEILQTAFE